MNGVVLHEIRSRPQTIGSILLATVKGEMFFLLPRTVHPSLTPWMDKHHPYLLFFNWAVENELGLLLI